MSSSSKGRLQLIRRLLSVLLLLFTLLVLVLVANLLGFSSRQLVVDPVERVAIDPLAGSRLSAAIALPTISYSDHIDTAAFLDLDTLIRKSFPRVHSSLKKLPVTPYSQVFHWAGRETDLRPVLLLAHLDVVPVEEAARKQWTHPPFSGQLADGYIWGRGTLDDKVSAFAILEAVEMLLAEGYEPSRSVYLAFGHDEEVSGLAGAAAIAAYFSRQHLRFEFVLDEGLVVLNNALAGLSSPLAMIGIAEKGFLTLDLQVELAEGGHSMMPPPETAIGILSRAIERLQRDPFPARIDGATRQFFTYVGPEMDLLYRMLFANLWLTEPLLIGQLSGDPAANALIRTTTAPTVIQGGVRANVLPTQAGAKINFRILPGETTATVIERVRKVIGDGRVLVSMPENGWQNGPSAVSAVDADGFRVIQKSIQELFPEAVVAPALVIGATDSRHYGAVSEQVYRFQPLQLDRADLSRIHGIDERVGEQAYQDAIRFYRQLIVNMAP